MLLRSSRVAAALALAGCGGGAETPCGLSARPLAPAVGFDANSDGAVDVADGAWLLARNFRGGADPPCIAAVEPWDSVDDSGTAYAIWYALIGGTAIPTLEPGTCSPPPDAPAACGDGLALAIAAPPKATGSASATFDAAVTLTSPRLPVEGWSLSVAATGCTVTAASLVGTVGADGGLAMAETSTSGGALSLVVLDPIDGTSVIANRDPILALTVDAPVGASCATCTLTLEDGQAGRGRALTNAVSSGGRSYRPAMPQATIQVCPG